MENNKTIAIALPISSFSEVNEAVPKLVAATEKNAEKQSELNTLLSLGLQTFNEQNSVISNLVKANSSFSLMQGVRLSNFDDAGLSDSDTSDSDSSITTIQQFIEKNSNYLPKPPEPTEQELETQKKSALDEIIKTAGDLLAVLNAKDKDTLSKEDIEAIGQLTSIQKEAQAEQENLTGKTVFEELDDVFHFSTAQEDLANYFTKVVDSISSAMNFDKLKEGDLHGFFSNLDVAFADVKDIIDGVIGDVEGFVAQAKEVIDKHFGDIISFGKGFFQSFSTMTDKNSEKVEEDSESELEILEKRIAEEEQLRDQQLQRNQDRYDEQSDSLEQLYTSGKIGYEDYIAGQLALDEEKNKADEEAVSGVEELERQKLEIENKTAKAEFENNKRQNMSDAAMSGAAAFVQALKIGPIMGPIAAAVIAAMVVGQIAQINSQQFTPKTALAQGGIVSSPTTALIGEGGEPEMVLPLSKAEDMGFSRKNETRIIININAPTYTGEDLTDCVYEGIRLAQRTGRLPRWN